MAQFTQDFPLLTPEEGQRSLIVLGLPLANLEVTEQSVRAALEAPYGLGLIERFYVRNDGHSQTALLIYQEPAQAELAATFSGEVLGEAVRTVRPTVVAPMASAQSPRAAQALARVSDGTARVMAETYIIGKKGVDAMKRFDDRHGITARVKRYDEMNKVSETVKSGVTAVGQGVRGVDSRYQISSTVKGVATTATDRALQNPHVASGAQGLNQFVGAVSSWSRRTLDTTKAIVRERTSSAGGGGAPAPETQPQPEPIVTAMAVDRVDATVPEVTPISAPETPTGMEPAVL
jgi:hypothetical protein